jgi:hypothetical protein
VKPLLRHDLHLPPESVEPPSAPLRLRHRSCWYETFTTECVLCGKGDRYRVRRYDSKPEDPGDRYHFSQFACDEHFL